MCCLITIAVFLGPRLGILFWYLFDPARWNEALNGFLLTCVGGIFLPWTTLMYVIVFTGGLGVFDYLLLAAAFIADLSSYGGGAYGNRERIPYNR